MVGQSPYSATKISADHIGLSFYRSFDMPVKIVRPFNTYGPRQSARAIIPTIISQIFLGKKQIRLGNLHPTRDLTFVTDTAKGFIEISRNDTLNGEITNIGMNHEISMKDLAEKIIFLMNSDVEIVTDSLRIRPDLSEVERLLCDNGKLLRHTSWTPDYNLDSGLRETIDWIDKNRKIYKAELYNV